MEDVGDVPGGDGVELGEGLRDSCFPIIVDDRRLMVTPNLYDALCLIRRSKRFRHHLWFDVICADQQLVHEAMHSLCARETLSVLFPVLLHLFARKNSEGYIMISPIGVTTHLGETYVHGVMHSEAVDRTNVAR